jgi:hypothetical protein
MQRFSRWPALPSPAGQAVCQRVDDASPRFFTQRAKGRAKFRQATKAAAFTFPQSGDRIEGRPVTRDGVRYKFVKPREWGVRSKP